MRFIHKWFWSFLLNKEALEIPHPLHPQTGDCRGNHAPASPEGGAVSLRLWFCCDDCRFFFLFPLHTELNPFSKQTKNKIFKSIGPKDGQIISLPKASTSSIRSRSRRAVCWGERANTCSILDWNLAWGTFKFYSFVLNLDCFTVPRFLCCINKTILIIRFSVVRGCGSWQGLHSSHRNAVLRETDCTL